MNFDNYLFHPSMLGDLMTEGRSKSDPFGETCKKALVSCFIEARYGRKKDLANKYVMKGLAVEEDSITLYSRVKKSFFLKNETTLSNDLFTGTPDLFIGESIESATEIIDIKSSWDIHTFFNVLINPINKKYVWQGQAYMNLTGAKKFRLAYCLVNTPEVMINDEKRKMMWRMGATTDEDPVYLDAIKELEKEMRFDDIDINDRYIEFEINYDQEMIDQAKEKLQLCRNFLNSINEKPELIESR